jgi:hypothetical protein
MAAARKIVHAPDKPVTTRTQTWKLPSIRGHSLYEFAQQQDPVDVSIAGEHALHHEMHGVVEEYRSCIRHRVMVHKQLADVSATHHNLLDLQDLNNATAGTLLWFSESIIESTEETLLGLQKRRRFALLAGLLQRNRGQALGSPRAIVRAKRFVAYDHDDHCRL